MKPFIYRIPLDMRNAISRLCIPVKRGDTIRRFIFMLMDNYAPYQITSECTAKFWAKTPDGTIISEDCTIENNSIVYNLPEKITEEEGKVYCELTLIGGNFRQITSPRFVLSIVPSIADWLGDTGGDGDNEDGEVYIQYEAGDNIMIIGSKISVITTDAVEEGNEKPVTSGAVAESIAELKESMSEIEIDLDYITETDIDELFNE